MRRGRYFRLLLSAAVGYLNRDRRTYRPKRQSSIGGEAKFAGAPGGLAGAPGGLAGAPGGAGGCLAEA